MAYRRIHCKGGYRYEEATTLGTVYPGMLVELDANNKLIPHNEAGGKGMAAFAIEDALQGKPVGTAYTSGTLGRYILPEKGSEVYAMLKTGQTTVIGSELVSDGSGHLQVRGSDGSGVWEWQIFAIALEAKTSSANDLIRVRII